VFEKVRNHRKEVVSEKVQNMFHARAKGGTVNYNNTL